MIHNMEAFAYISGRWRWYRYLPRLDCIELLPDRPFPSWFKEYVP